MADKGKTSPWVWVGCGCLGALLLIVGAFGAFLFSGYRWAKGLEETMRDPVKRTERVKEILGSDELPPGYFAVAGLTVPLFAEIAVISTKQPEPDSEPDDLGDTGFVYVKVKWPMAEKKRELRDFIEGKSDTTPDILLQSNIRIDSDEVIGRGELQIDGVSMPYVVNRGDLHVEGSGGKGIAAMVMVDCPQESRVRIGIWFGADPALEETHEEVEVDLSGTPADESALRDFFSYFSFCEN